MQTLSEQQRKHNTHIYLYKQPGVVTKSISKEPFLLLKRQVAEVPLPRYNEKIIPLPFTIDGYDEAIDCRDTDSTTTVDQFIATLTASKTAPTTFKAFETFCFKNTITYTKRRVGNQLLKVVLDPADECKDLYWEDEQYYNWYVFTVSSNVKDNINWGSRSRRIDDTTVIVAIKITDTVKQKAAVQRQVRELKARQMTYYNNAVAYIFNNNIDSYDEEDRAQVHQNGKEAIRCYFESIFNVFLDDDAITDDIVKYIKRHVTLNEVDLRLNGKPVPQTGTTLESIIKNDNVLYLQVVGQRRSLSKTPQNS